MANTGTSLADVVEQGHDGHALIRDGVHHFPGGEVFPAAFVLVPKQEAPQGIQNIEAMLKQAATVPRAP